MLQRKGPSGRPLAADKSPVYPPLLMSIFAVTVVVVLCGTAYSVALAVLW